MQWRSNASVFTGRCTKADPCGQGPADRAKVCTEFGVDSELTLVTAARLLGSWQLRTLSNTEVM